ncbi:hypothetical protein GCM10009085_43250 [Pseudomonas avellanae]|nr:hypothetical protein GCM10009085_43250 [Pseudomonas avellanae]
MLHKGIPGVDTWVNSHILQRAAYIAGDREALHYMSFKGRAQVLQIDPLSY